MDLIEFRGCHWPLDSVGNSSANGVRSTRFFAAGKRICNRSNFVRGFTAI